MSILQKQRLAWAITGSGHYLRECLDVLQALKNQDLTPVDVFLSKAAAEIIKQYGFQAQLDASGHRIFQDKTASSIPVEFFYQGQYHTLVIAPATSNTVAKMAYGFSDSLVTNLYAQAGKTRVASIVFACDTVPALGNAFIESEAPRENIVKVFPRQIDLENVAKLSQFELTRVVDSIDTLEASIHQRLNAVSIK